MQIATFFWKKYTIHFFRAKDHNTDFIGLVKKAGSAGF